ncbi:MAG: beta-ketoacyl-[acyl-carrier-protein] synthase family protein, partial [Desulfuromonadaceae bacterium]|nr:beta-ketoacyl-[acyl-carrier-protein] synthase family protein [Desulfuromonadaceae bacterium]
MYRVAITGIGIVSCLGNDLSSVGNALREGRSGIVIDPQRVELGFRSPLTGQIQDFDPSLLSRKQRKTMPDFAVWTYASACAALELAGLAADAIQNEQTGLIYGCDSSSVAAVEQVDALRDRG